MFENIKTYGNLSEGVVNQIIQKINEGALKPGDKLPAERELCALLGVSRTVIRDALKTLAGLGIVSVRHGMGAYVNMIAQEEDVSRLASLLQITRGTVEELFQVRKILESQAVVWCTERARKGDVEQLQHIVEQGKRGGDESRLALLDAEFHLKICSTTGNRVLMRLMLNLLDLLGENRARVLMVPGRQRQSVDDHAAIVEAIVAIKPDLARATMVRHLESVERAISNEHFNKDDGDNFF